MKKIAVLIYLLFIVISCSKNSDNNSASPTVIENTITGTYAYTDPDCTKTKTVSDCTDYIEFLNSSEASVILRENDIVYVTDYTIENSTIQLKKAPVSNTILSFKIENDSTLKRIENGSVWKKEK